LQLSRTTTAILLIAALAATVTVLFVVPGAREQTMDALRLAARADIGPLRDSLLALGWWAPVLSAVLQVITSIIAPLPSFVLAFVNAMLFGFWWGGAAHLDHRDARGGDLLRDRTTLGRPAVERFVPRGALESTDRFFHRNGIMAVVVARLIPFINPDVLSYAAGLTAMSWRPFMLGIGAGAIPSTILYSYLGSRGVTSVGWLLIPLVVLGLITLGGALVHRSSRPGSPLPES
jgi:uncharacterized membrane protein YdjX (TVP38/TMEM64 family)